jgi:hypothetical protein
MFLTMFLGGKQPFPNVNEGNYVIQTNGRQQIIWGFGYEVYSPLFDFACSHSLLLPLAQIQSDSIGSNNQGMPGNGHLVPDDDNTTSSAPHDLTESERLRFATDMLQGFRYCRLALGLFLRGLDPSQERVIARWPSQLAELQQMQDVSGIEGTNPANGL